MCCLGENEVSTALILRIAYVSLGKNRAKLFSVPPVNCFAHIVRRLFLEAVLLTVFCFQSGVALAAVVNAELLTCPFHLSASDLYFEAG